jgi:hypothetical protein
MRFSLGIERVLGTGNYVFRCQLLQLIRRACVSARSNPDMPGIAADSRLRERFAQAALIASE